MGSAVCSIQRPLERALQTLLGGVTPTDYTIVAAHDIESLPDEGNYIAVMAGPGDFEEYIDNALCKLEFRVATRLMDPDARVTRSSIHQQTVGAIANLLSYQNFETARDALNAQDTPADGVTIGFSGWGQIGPPMDAAADTQLISTLPYEFDVFIADVDSS